ncbi:MAG: SCO family protein [Alphaproteobacteria bacterium]
MQGKARIGLAIGTVIFGCGVGVAAAYMFDLFPDSSRNAAASREGGPGGPFNLTAHTGELVSDTDFHGRYTLVFFGFTFCPDICPTTLADMATVMDRLGDDAAAVQPLFVTVDPERDTPEQLAAYVAAFDDRIVGLTGSAAEIETIADAYGVYYEVAPDEVDPEFYLINHTAGVYFMDQQGRFVRVFSSQTPADEMVESIRAVMQEDAAG